MDTEQTKHSLSQALETLQRLEMAIGKANHRAIGFELTTLRQELLKLQRELESKPSQSHKKSGSE
jgi:hypothetical protein